MTIAEGGRCRRVLAMKTLDRRLAALERALRANAMEEQVIALAFQTGGDDLMFIGQEWLPCPNAAAIIARGDLPVKVYLGMTLEMLVGPRKRRPRDAGSQDCG